METENIKVVICKDVSSFKCPCDGISPGYVGTIWIEPTDGAKRTWHVIMFANLLFLNLEKSWSLESVF